MHTINATDMRKDFGKYIDEIVRTKPVVVKRSRDYFMGISVEMALELVEDTMFTAEEFIEEDRSVTLSLIDYDIVINGSDRSEAINLLVQELREYAEEYYNDMRFWSSDVARKKQMKGIVKILLTKDDNTLKESIQCRVGEN